MADMTEKALKTILKYNMLARADSVSVAVSGGADSVSLLHFLASLRGEWRLQITALHLNHKLRGAESDRDESVVRELCGRLGVELLAEAADVRAIAAERGLSLEEAGRTARYEFFRRAAAERNARIATAHTLNDSLETVLINLARGTALRGLCGIAPVRGDIIRPLIECERAEIERYCEQNGLGYIHDSSNDSDDFSRNRLRHHAFPALLSVNPGLYRNAAATLESLRADADYLDAVAEKSLWSISLYADRYMREGYLALDKPIRFRALLRLLSQYGIAADRQRLSRLDSIIAEGLGRGEEQLADGIWFKSRGGYFFISGPEEIQEYFCVPAEMPGPSEMAETTVFSGKKLRLMNTVYEYYEENIKYQPKLLKNALDCDRINGIVKCRQREPGDRIRLSGRGCTKTLKKIFNEAGLSLAERSRILVLEDSDGPLWVEGVGVAERAAVCGKTRGVLILEVQNGG